MKLQSILKSSLILLCLVVIAADVAETQPTPPRPHEVLPDPRFPRGSDKDATEFAEKSIKRARDEDFKTGRDKGEEFYDKFDRDSGRFPKHPWSDGRDPVSSALDWIQDSKFVIGTGVRPGDTIWDMFSNLADLILGIPRFMSCFEPRLVLPFCEFCQPPLIRCPCALLDLGCFLRCHLSCPYERNTGYVFSYWWPESEAETHDFAISAFNPLFTGHSARDRMLIRPLLTQQIELIFGRLFLPLFLQYHGADKAAEFPDGLRQDPHLGHTAFSGILPGDQTQYTEAHVYETAVAKHTSDLRSPMRGEPGWRFRRTKYGCVALPFWYNGWKLGNHECFYSTLPEKTPDTVHGWTEELQFAPFWRVAELSVALDRDKYFKSAPMVIPFSPQGLIAEGLFYPTAFPTLRSCASYRTAKWEDRYGDLQTAVGIAPNEFDGGEDLCYFGGGELFPVTGAMMGHHSLLPTSAYFARRALYLTERIGPNPTRIFSDIADKLQRIYPEPTGCFRVNDIDEYNTDMFPKEGDLLSKSGSVRHVYWNMRVACVCPYRGVYQDWLRLPINIPPPFTQWGCHPWWGTEFSKGNEEKQGIIGLFPPLPPWPFWFPLLPRYTETAEQLYPFGCGWTETCGVTVPGG